MTTCGRFLSVPILFHILLLIATVTVTVDGRGGGEWQLLQKSIGIVAMHMQLLHNDRVVVFDRTDFGQSNLTLPNGRCRNDSQEVVLKIDCTAHSIEYDVASNSFRPLFVQTDVWCSSGSVSPNGTLVQTGGDFDGMRAVRTFIPCPTCDWQEDVTALAVKRWYATNQILPDGRQIIIGGTKQFNYEFYPRSTAEPAAHDFPFLAETNDPGAENNLYPFVFLNVDGNLFIFANNRAILFDYNKNAVVRTYPTIPGGDPRNYPSTGSAVLLPLVLTNSTLQPPSSVEAEVLICGGAPRGSFQLALKGQLIGALRTCARIKITDPNPAWVMESMPGPRLMNDMVMLPNGNVLLINGAATGVANWELGRDPVLNPFIYKPNNRVGSRFESQSPSSIPRMYHSGAVLVRDGRVLVAGSNPHLGYNFTNVLFPTELRLEAFSPPYLKPKFSIVRPRIASPDLQSQTTIGYGQRLRLRFEVTAALVPDSVSVTMLAPPFNTHSFSMNQRLLVLERNELTTVWESTYEVEVTAPSSAILAPPGFYLVFVVHQNIPSHGIWVQIL